MSSKEKKLPIPKNKNDLNECPTLTLMRLRVKDEPAVGMIINGNQYQGVSSQLIWIGKDEILHQSILGYVAAEFVDYATEDESITIFGNASERTDDDLSLEPVNIGFGSIPDGLKRLYDIPIGIPFVFEFRQHTYQGLILHSQIRDEGKVCLLYAENACDQWINDVSIGDPSSYISRISDYKIERWKTHDLFKGFVGMKWEEAIKP